MTGASVVTFLANKLGSVLAEKMKEEVSVVVKFKEEFESINQELVHIKLMLNDDGERTNSETMANWVQNLRDVLTDAMDLLEECQDADNAHTSILANPIFNNPIGHRINLLHRKSRQLIFKYQKGREIKQLKDKIDKINSTGKQYLEYLKSLVDVNTFAEQEKANSNSPFAKNDQIVRIHEDDINVITKKLLEENDTRVIAVWGMGGIGKSTMIRHVFDSEKVQKRFKHRVWLTVSEKFKINHLLHDIAEQINLPRDEIANKLTEVRSESLRIKYLRIRIHKYLGEEGDMEKVEQEKPYDQFSLEGLKIRILRYLGGEQEKPSLGEQEKPSLGEQEKPSLFVLDDVWDQSVFQQIGFGGENKTNKYKIVMITRDKGVSNAIRADSTHEMKYLSDEDSLKLFNFHAFPDGNLPDHLESFRPDILKKCTRLPKAVEAIGKSMKGVSMIVSHWEMALQSLNKEEVIERDVMPTLRTSYEALPHHLKACFLYFASFPACTKLKSEFLVYAWLANFRDFLPSGAEGLDTAWSYMDQLVDRCVIQASEYGVHRRVRYCHMEEFFHGLAVSESHKEAMCFLKCEERLEDFPVQECKDARRIALAKTRISSIKDAIKCPDLRILSLRDNTKLSSISGNFFDKLKYIVVLDLSRTGIKTLPDSIGNLKRVKFLNLSGSKIEELPKSLSSLRNLLFLDVSNCEDLRRLHSGIGNHTLMQCLDVTGCKNLGSLPSGLSKLRFLTRLRLKGVVFDKKATDDAFGWTGFKNFTEMHTLSVTFSSETSLSDSLQTWECLVKMRVLSLQYRPSSDECCTLPKGLGFMENLEKLRLNRLLVPRPATSFWEYQLQNLMELTLEGDDSDGGSYYSAIENIPKLKKLTLSGNKNCSQLPKEFGGPNAFPKLERLIITAFKNLETFPDLQAHTMPFLKYFRITDCNKMKEFPGGLENLKSLEKLRLDHALLKSNHYRQIENASGVLIWYELQKSYRQIVDDHGDPINNITFLEAAEDEDMT